MPPTKLGEPKTKLGEPKTKLGEPKNYGEREGPEE